VQEIAFTIADGIEYIRAMVKRKRDVDSFAPRLSFSFRPGHLCWNRLQNLGPQEGYGGRL